MKRIAILFESTGNGNYGAQNATLERIKHLKALGKYQIDVYMLQKCPDLLTRVIKKNARVGKINKLHIDGIDIRVLTYHFRVVDYLLEFKIGIQPRLRMHRFRQLAQTFKDYDMVSAHMQNSGIIARMAQLAYGTPYTITWHGSDIHTTPFCSKVLFNNIKAVIESADMNLFVSKALMLKSKDITLKSKNMVLYNGIDKTRFYRYTVSQRAASQAQFGINSSYYNIAFVGQFVPIKNVLCLPKVFQLISKQMPEVAFHFAGDGRLYEQLKQLCAQYNLHATFYGQLAKEQMPDFYNAIDLLILPSFNEGLPLVVPEAKACGAEVIASRVGGIAEVIGNENTVPHGTHFEEKLAALCIQKQATSEVTPLAEQFDWNHTAQLECKVYDTILSIH